MSLYVPTYRVDFSSGKRFEFCVVIPVVNEGERIISLLRKMVSLGISGIADVIIVDGGSTDGSLEPKRLKDLGVETLLTKIDSGKLSAQLLCAYAYARERGYKGVLTIDGNDKDDPKDIPLFIQKLNEGYDFVQASRFVLGGFSSNTPLLRYLAIRLLHAPMLSLASGFWWTDTTQGFRAYSARMLFSGDLEIFRDVFQDYELLAFISYAGPKFGYKCVEVGTRRVYPRGKVPTKISSVRGNLRLLITLWHVCMGRYNP